MTLTKKGFTENTTAEITIKKSASLGASGMVNELMPSYKATKTAVQIGGATDTINYLKPLFSDVMEYQEMFVAMYLNRANKVIGHQIISLGGVSDTMVDPKLIFSTALKCLASNIILCHNHPSGNLKPSQSDLDLTKKIKSGGEILDISILDHIIITYNGSLSFADEGIM